MDTGAEGTICNSQSSPSTWLTRPASTALIGLGSLQSVSQSMLPLSKYIGSDEQEGIITPFITPIPVDLWHTGLLKEWNTYFRDSKSCIIR